MLLESTALRRAIGVVCALACAGCAMPVENPPVYESQRFLCADEHSDAWRDAVDDCHEDFERDQSCAGVLSFTGQLEGEAVTVESLLGTTEFLDLRADGEGSELRQELKLKGASPYFQFVFSWLDIGGDLTGEADDRTLHHGTAEDRDTVLDDDRVRTAFRLTVGGESRALTPREAELTTERQRIDEHVATFNADFGASGDYLEGCFHAFPIEHRFSLEVDSDVH